MGFIPEKILGAGHGSWVVLVITLTRWYEGDLLFEIRTCILLKTGREMGLAERGWLVGESG